MHFPTFAVASTNIFPLSNSSNGGQLVSEYNLRAREMVATDPNIKYEVGPSFVHGPDDFAVSLLSGLEASEYDSTQTYSIGEYVTYNSATYVCIEAVVTPEPFDKNKWLEVIKPGSTASTSIIQIAPGRAVINGHYVQTLAPMIIDLALANAQLSKLSQAPLIGELCVGIKAYYSTESTMAGSMLVENEDNTYTGVQLVVELKDNFKTPSDSPTDRSKVTADLKLADFIYVNGSINPEAIIQNKYKVSYLNSGRIDNIAEVLDDNFISKKTLNPHKLYTFSGQGSSTKKNTWCDSTGSLMVWDANPEAVEMTDDPNKAIPQATFVSTNDGFVHLIVPHQQIDQAKSFDNSEIYFPPRDIKLPKANYLSGSSGTVDAEYTQVIKNLSDKVGSLKQSPAGRMILWLDSKDEKYVMPTIPDSGYENGDYIFVREDYTAQTEDSEGAPSTMYKVLPGTVQAVQYSETMPTGVRLGDTSGVIWAGDSVLVDSEMEAMAHLADFYDTTKPYHVGDYVAHDKGTYKCKEDTSGEWDANDWDMLIPDNVSTLFDYTSFKGTTGQDYFQVDYHNTRDNVIVPFYYKVSGTSKQTWSKYILITGGIPLANVDQIGGFYNTDPTEIDGGYVTLDDSGRLKLIDYELLRNGALAYQLGSDYKTSATLTAEALQEVLDEYVNNRVAFSVIPTISALPNVIHLYITLPAEEQTEEPTQINICNIDSRFGTAVHLHILGEATSYTILNIVDCEKIRIDSNISGTPVINVVRSCIYYDASVFNYIRACDTHNFRANGATGFTDITLWYNQFEETDPALLVTGMEISQPDAPLASQDIAFWNEDNPNDNHYSYALRSITFSGTGDIVGCSVMVADNSTATNVTSGRAIIGDTFDLPQGTELSYPKRCLVSPLKVTGSFTTAYKPGTINEWIVIDTNFTLKTGEYQSSTDDVSSGTAAFDSVTEFLSAAYMNAPTKVIGGVPSIDGWEAGSFHIFYGGTTL